MNSPQQTHEVHLRGLGAMRLSSGRRRGRAAQPLTTRDSHNRARAGSPRRRTSCRHCGEFIRSVAGSAYSPGPRPSRSAGGMRLRAGGRCRNGCQARAGTLPSKRMNSPQQTHEVHLRGLGAMRLSSGRRRGRAAQPFTTRDSHHRARAGSPRRRTSCRRCGEFIPSVAGSAYSPGPASTSSSVCSSNGFAEPSAWCRSWSSTYARTRGTCEGEIVKAP